MNIEQEEENILDIKTNDEKDPKEEENFLLSKKRLRPKVIKNNYIYLYNL